MNEKYEEAFDEIAKLKAVRNEYPRITYEELLSLTGETLSDPQHYSADIQRIRLDLAKVTKTVSNKNTYFELHAVPSGENDQTSFRWVLEKRYGDGLVEHHRVHAHKKIKSATDLGEQRMDVATEFARLSPRSRNLANNMKVILRLLQKQAEMLVDETILQIAAMHPETPESTLRLAVSEAAEEALTEEEDGS